jgi:hypothetical protein
MKFVDFEKLYNFVVDNFFIWIRLGSQTLNLNSFEDNMSRKKIYYRHEWVWGAVVREVLREGEVVGLIPGGCEAHVATQWSLLGFKKIPNS